MGVRVVKIKILKKSSEKYNLLLTLFKLCNIIILVLRERLKKNISKICRGVEQLAARRAHNPKVTGSSPVPATKYA